LSGKTDEDSNNNGTREKTNQEPVYPNEEGELEGEEQRAEIENVDKGGEIPNRKSAEVCAVDSNCEEGESEENKVTAFQRINAKEL
jgi:hypothetical protein